MKVYTFPAPQIAAALPFGWGLKGGAARAALIEILTGVQITLRDLDLIAPKGASYEERLSVGEEWCPEDTERGFLPEVWEGLGRYFRSRDFTVNEVVIFGDTLYATKAAVRAVLKREIHLTSFERGDDDGVSYKLGTKGLYLAAVLGHQMGEKWLVARPSMESDWWTALMYTRAFEVGAHRAFHRLRRDLNACVEVTWQDDALNSAGWSGFVLPPAMCETDPSPLEWDFWWEVQDSWI